MFIFLSFIKFWKYSEIISLNILSASFVVFSFRDDSNVYIGLYDCVLHLQFSFSSVIFYFHPSDSINFIVLYPNPLIPFLPIQNYFSNTIMHFFNFSYYTSPLQTFLLVIFKVLSLIVFSFCSDVYISYSPCAFLQFFEHLEDICFEVIVQQIYNQDFLKDNFCWFIIFH